MLGKAMMKLFIASEIVFAAGFYGWTVLLTDIYGLEGVSIAHAINYSVYLIVMGVFIGNFVLKSHSGYVQQK
jgi:PST family polysaccharide transporter